VAFFIYYSILLTSCMSWPSSKWTVAWCSAIHCWIEHYCVLILALKCALQGQKADIFVLYNTMFCSMFTWSLWNKFNCID